MSNKVNINIDKKRLKKLASQKPIRVMIGIPSSVRTVDIKFHEALIDLITYVMDNPIVDGRIVVLGVHHETYFGHNLAYCRNSIFKTAVKTGADVLVCMDSDMILEPNAIHKFVQHWLHGRKVVSGLCFGVRPFRPLIFQEPSEADFKKNPHALREQVVYKAGEMIKVYAIGTGCFMMDGKTIGAYGKPWFKYYDERDDLHQAYKNVGEDFYFSEILRATNQDIFVDTDIEVGHIGTDIYGKTMWQRYGFDKVYAEKEAMTGEDTIQGQEDSSLNNAINRLEKTVDKIEQTDQATGLRLVKGK